jgi:hypothetical protein
MSCFVCFGSAQDGGEGKKQVADAKDAAARKDGPPPPPDRRGVVVGSGASRVWAGPDWISLGICSSPPLCSGFELWLGGSVAFRLGGILFSFPSLALPCLAAARD